VIEIVETLGTPVLPEANMRYATSSGLALVRDDYTRARRTQHLMRAAQQLFIRMHNGGNWNVFTFGNEH
jgi:hypothetical protein